MFGMTHQDKTAVLTVKIQLPTRSAEVASEKYIAPILAAIREANVPASDLGLRFKGVSVVAP